MKNKNNHHTTKLHIHREYIYTISELLLSTTIWIYNLEYKKLKEGNKKSYNLKKTDDNKNNNRTNR